MTTVENPTERTAPLVSVVIPVYNAEQAICETLDSVFSQTHQNLQVIVVDDASADGSVERIQRYSDPRLELLRLPKNGNVVAARNAGLDRVKGDYVAFLDSDDLWLPEKLEKQLAFLEQNPSCGACFTWGEIIDENSRPHSPEHPRIRWLHDVFHEGNRTHREWLLRLLRGGNFFLTSSSLIRTDIVQKVGKQNLALLQLQDYEYWIRVLSHCDAHILCEELTRYRRVIDGESLSAARGGMRIRLKNETISVCTHFFDHISDELFVSLFREDFRNKDSATRTELDCEKAFLLEKTVCGKEPFFMNIERLLSNTDSASVLAEKFGYSQKNFYADNTQRRYMSPWEYQTLSREFEEAKLCNKEMIQRLRKELVTIKGSASYRIGRMITYIPRKIRGGIRCCKEHGLGYTFKHFLKKIHK